MKKKFLISLVFMIFLLWGRTAYCASPADVLQEQTEQQINQMDTSQWDNFVNKLSKEYDGIAVKPLAQAVRDTISGQGGGFNEAINLIKSCFLSNLPALMALMIKVLILGILCGVLEKMQGALGETSVIPAAKFVIFALTAILLFDLLKGAVSDAVMTLDRMVEFLQIILPILIVFLVSMGAAASAGMMQPVGGIMFGIIGSGIKGLVLPISLSSAAVSMINSLSDHIKIDKLAALLKSIAQWAMGGMFTIFVGITAIKGLTAASFDGVMLRTAKFAVSSFLPVIGGMVGDSADLVIGSSLLVKNGVGVAGLTIIALICVAPCLRLLAIVFALRACAAVMQPAADSVIVKCIHDVADAVQLLFLALVGTGLMVFLTIALTIGLGNVAVMMR